MTNEEQTIANLRKLKSFHNGSYGADIDRAIKSLEQHPCDDALSRILKRMWNCRGKHTTSIDKVKMEQILRDELSSINPQPKTREDKG